MQAVEHSKLNPLPALKPCPLGLRSLALVVDIGITSGLVGVLVFLSVLPFLVVVAVFFQKIKDLVIMDPTLAIAMMCIVLFGGLILCLFSIHVYFIFFEWRFKGQTPGKKIFGVKVISLDGKPLTLKQCIKREFYRYVDHLLIFPVFIGIRNSPLGQRVGDRAANTTVIHLVSEEKEAESLFLPHHEYERLSPFLKIEAFPQNFENDFLAWAFPIFITHMKRALPEDMALKIQSLKPYLQLENNSADLSLVNLETTLRLFAEYCRRQLAQNKRSIFHDRF